MGLVGKRLPDNTMPEQPGEYSIFRQIPRPPVLAHDEVYMVCPQGKICALVPEIHTWSEDEQGNLTVHPSIVNPNSGYHGFLAGGVWH